MATKTPASPYVPSFLKASLTDSRAVQLTFSDISDTNIRSTSSFFYDPANAPIKNTQQLTVDWSKFENHTFFSSAEVKTNTAFDQIINGYPFDGSKLETEKFFENLTGFDKYVFDQFPRFKGYLHFSGSQVGEDTDGTRGIWIAVKDNPGALYPEISKNNTGQAVLVPDENTSFTIEAQIYVPSISNATQVILQKLSGSTNGFSLYLLPSVSTSSVDASFSVVSGTTSMTTTTTLTKGVFNHVCLTLNREIGNDYLEFFLSSERKNTSKDHFNIGPLQTSGQDFIIGSGSLLSLSSGNILPTQTFSGSIDELRVFHSIRTISQQQLFAKKTIFSMPELKLYYKFNEPPPPIGLNDTDSINSIVLDSSGNSLHSLINNFTGTLRISADENTGSPLPYEKDETSPILFPAHPDVVALNIDLLTSASEYDVENPNLITKLVPQHYLLEGAQQDGFTDIEGLLGQQYSGTGIPGQGQIGSSQIMLSFLYIWAKFFDEIKLYVESFGNLRFVDYDTTDTIPSNFLNDLVKQFGINLPPLFNDSTIDQYINAENIGQEIATSAFPLKYVQEQLLRRTLISLPNILRSKGTQHSIKSFLRSVGIDPDNSLRIREFGGPTTKQLSFSRENKREQNVMAVFATSSLATSAFLSASRIEPGFPEMSGFFADDRGIPTSDNPQDGFLTSGSWSVEGIYKFTFDRQDDQISETQSLFRINSTGSLGLSLLANVVALSSSTDSSIIAYLRSGMDPTSPVLQLKLSIPDNQLFNSQKWNVVFGCERNDAINSSVSSSYFLRAACQENGKIETVYTTSSFFYEQHADTFMEGNALRQISSFSIDFDTNTILGPFLEIGENRTYDTTLGYFLNDNTFVIDDAARETKFRGQVSNFRFWTKALTVDEWKEHVRNYKSLGVHDPLLNYNFVTKESGSFERLRLDTFTKQIERRGIASASLGTPGDITFLDFSLNNNHMLGTGFPIDSDCLVGELFEYSYLSPMFDEASTDEKIRIRSYLNQDLIDETPWAQTAPVYELPKNEQPTDDTRLSIEFSLIDALNRDIVNMFSTFDAIDNAIGSPELMFSSNYPDLDKLRNIYFNRISSKLNYKDFFEFFRWFDMSIGTFIEQLIPRKTKFKGTNFVIESHMLERHKLEYYSNEMYLEENTRSRINDVLLLQQIAGVLRKY